VSTGKKGLTCVLGRSGQDVLRKKLTCFLPAPNAFLEKNYEAKKCNMCLYNSRDVHCFLEKKIFGDIPYFLEKKNPKYYNFQDFLGEKIPKAIQLGTRSLEIIHMYT
jgi:hypothetical protein